MCVPSLLRLQWGQKYKKVERQRRRQPHKTGPPKLSRSTTILQQQQQQLLSAGCLCMLDTLLDTSASMSHVILCRRSYRYAHFIDEETEALNGVGTCPRSHSQGLAELGGAHSQSQSCLRQTALALLTK